MSYTYEGSFEQYWEEKGHFGSTPEDVARLAWKARDNEITKIRLQTAQECSEIADIFHSAVGAAIRQNFGIPGRMR